MQKKISEAIGIWTHDLPESKRTNFSLAPHFCVTHTSDMAEANTASKWPQRSFLAWYLSSTASIYHMTQISSYICWSKFMISTPSPLLCNPYLQKWMTNRGPWPRVFDRGNNMCGNLEQGDWEPLRIIDCTESYFSVSPIWTQRRA